MEKDKKTWVERVGKQRTAVNENNSLQQQKALSEIKPASTAVPKIWAEKVGKKPPVKATPSTPITPTKGKGRSK